MSLASILGSETVLTGPSPTISRMTTSITSHTTILLRKQPVAEKPALPTDPCMCRTGTPSSSGNTVPVPVSSHGSSMVTMSGTILSPTGTDGPETNSEPASTPPTAVTVALRMPFSVQKLSTTSWRTSPSSRRRTNTLPSLSSADLMSGPQRHLLYLSSSLQILSNSSLVRSPESRKVFTKSFASLVETRDALAMTDARNEEGSRSCRT